MGWISIMDPENKVWLNTSQHSKSVPFLSEATSGDSKDWRLGREVICGNFTENWSPWPIPAWCLRRVEEGEERCESPRGYTDPGKRQPILCGEGRQHSLAVIIGSRITCISHVSWIGRQFFTTKKPPRKPHLKGRGVNFLEAGWGTDFSKFT